ncbi:MAG: ABC transporter permease subunit [Planctomycetales bacterium]|nr:ABC transporter permease subunit [Planctomycetales bacterium]
MNRFSEHVNDQPDRPESKPEAGQTASSFFRVLRLARKELRESLRDRRTLVTLLVMPLIVYPLLGTLVQKFAIQRINPDSPPAVVVFDTSISGELAAAILEDRTGDDVPREMDVIPHVVGGAAENATRQDAVPSLQNVASSLTGTSTAAAIGSLIDSADSNEPPILFERFTLSANAQTIGEFLQTVEADVGVRQSPAVQDATTGKIQPTDFQVLSRSGDAFSLRAAVEVEKRLLAFRDRQLRILLDKTKFGSGSMPTISRQVVATNSPKSSPLDAFLPLMLVLMTMTGAVYPAIDLTAGERERGTLEILVAAPVSRRHLLTGKFIAVLTVAVLTAVINLIAMLLTLYATGFDRILLEDGATFGMFFRILALLVVFASFFSAVLLSITSFARSFREAQAWLIPLMLVSLAPGILSLMPGVHLTVGLALVPLVNIVLLGRDLFQGTAATNLYAVTLFSTLVYAVLALRVAAGVFGSDSVLFGSSASLATFRKRPREIRTQIPLQIGVGWMLLLVPLFLVLSGLRSRVVPLENLSGQLILSGLLTVLLFAAIPVAITKWVHVSPVEVFALHKFHMATLIGAALLGCTMWTIAYQVLIFSKAPLQWMEILNNTKLKELAERLTSETPFLIRIVTLSLIPAVCEELCFRGFLVNTLQKNGEAWLRPMLISTFVFAAFHVIVDQSLTLERFPATFLLGLVLCGVRLSSGSIFPAIVMHSLSNGLLLSLKELDPIFELIGLNLNSQNESSLPTWFLVASILISCTGAWFVWLGRKRGP